MYYTETLLFFCVSICLVIIKIGYFNGDKNEYFTVKKNLFIKNFVELCKNPDDNYGIFVNLHLAYSAACGENIKSKKIIILNVHNIEHLKNLKSSLGKIMPDADLDKAVAGLMGAAYGSAGERCMAQSATNCMAHTMARTGYNSAHPRRSHSVRRQTQSDDTTTASPAHKTTNQQTKGAHQTNTMKALIILT